MSMPRVMPIDCISCTAILVDDVEATRGAVASCLESMGVVRRENYSVWCAVVHPDKLQCTVKAEVPYGITKKKSIS